MKKLMSGIGYFRHIEEINGRKKIKNIIIRMYEVVCKDIDNLIHLYFYIIVTKSLRVIKFLK